MKLIHNVVIGFAVNPGKLWILQAGKMYEMHVQVFDEENNRIRVDDVSDFPNLTKTLWLTSMKGVKKYFSGVNKTTRWNVAHFVVSFVFFEQRWNVVFLPCYHTCCFFLYISPYTKQRPVCVNLFVRLYEPLIFTFTTALEITARFSNFLVSIFLKTLLLTKNEFFHYGFFY